MQGPYLLLTARATCQETQTRAQLRKHCIFPNFETLPLHFIPRHPSPTQHLPRYLRVTSFLFVSCRSLTSSLHTPLGFFSWDHSSPGLPTQSRRHHVPALHRGHGLSATPVTSLGSGRHGPRVKTSSCAARLLAHRAPPWDRPWRDASPQDLERITVRLPSGIGHGKGPGSATADLVYP